jgi:hypothetical protein
MKINRLLNKIAFFTFFLAPNVIFAQLGVNSDNSAPHTSSMLDVKSATKGVLIPRVASDLASPTEGLLYYNTTGHNFRYYDGTAWQNALFGNQWNVNGSKISYSLGNVGIGVADPLYKLDVSGSINASGNILAGGNLIANFIGIGTPNPNFKVHIFDGSVAFYNTTDLKTWSINYNSGNNGIQFNEDGASSRLNIENGGNVGIGVVNPATKLDVAGTIHTSTNIDVDGTGAVGGALTVNGGKGVAYNPSTATNLKIIPFTTATFVAILGPHGISAEGAIALPAGFTSTPKVFVGDIDVTGGTTGQLYMVELQLYGCNTTSCKARLVNRSAGSVDYSITWNCVAIGN